MTATCVVYHWRTWKTVVRGETILCPATNLPEKVTSTRAYVPGRWFVRTNRHDHMRPSAELVRVIGTLRCPRCRGELGHGYRVSASGRTRKAVAASRPTATGVTCLACATKRASELERGTP